MGDLLNDTPDVTARAVAALRGGQETFDRSQVAFVLGLAFRAAVADDMGDDPAAATLAYRAGYAQGYDDGENAAYAEVHADLRYALGGPEAQTMAQAVRVAQRDITRREHRAKAEQVEPYPLRLDDPEWPPVTVPGTVADPRSLPGEWRCPCPRDRHGGHVTPKADPDQWWRPIASERLEVAA